MPGSSKILTGIGIGLAGYGAYVAKQLYDAKGRLEGELKKTRFDQSYNDPNANKEGQHDFVDKRYKGGNENYPFFKGFFDEMDNPGKNRPTDFSNEFYGNVGNLDYENLRNTFSSGNENMDEGTLEGFYDPNNFTPEKGSGSGTDYYTPEKLLELERGGYFDNNYSKENLITTSPLDYSLIEKPHGETKVNIYENKTPSKSWKPKNQNIKKKNTFSPKKGIKKGLTDKETKEAYESYYKGKSPKWNWDDVDEDRGL